LNELDPESVMVAGQMRWYVPGSGRGGTEFVCGGFSPASRELQIWGTHVDEIGSYLLSCDVYKLMLDPSGLFCSGQCVNNRDEDFTGGCLLSSTSLFSPQDNTMPAESGVEHISAEDWGNIFPGTNFVPPSVETNLLDEAPPELAEIFGTQEGQSWLETALRCDITELKDFWENLHSEHPEWIPVLNKHGEYIVQLLMKEKGM